MESLDAGDCTSAICPVEKGFFREPPSLVGAVILLALFTALVPINLWIGARYKTTTYSLTLVLGLLVEVVAYVGRLLLRSDLASKTYFLLFLLGTTMGPTFITAAIYSILPHIVALYGSDVSVVQRPIWLSYFFLIFDLFALAFQALGSAFAAEGFDTIQVSLAVQEPLLVWFTDQRKKVQQGINVLIAGLVLQLASIVIFFGVYFLFMRQVVQNRNFLDPRFSDVYLSARFKTSLLCTSPSTPRPQCNMVW